mmetsp:Transcript_28782/g.81060  ORF Transcript_28782/g.81060 Transcript_28782/m.81060 type:complete len:366 (-) Transcript_28782:82-1179(-)
MDVLGRGPASLVAAMMLAMLPLPPCHCVRYVSVETSNGVNNQRESILNGLLVAHAIDGTFVLPTVYPIWYKDAIGNSAGNQKWKSSSYRQPWTGMDVSGRRPCPLSSLFDEESLVETATRLGIGVTSSLPRRKMKMVPIPFHYKWNWFAGVDDLLRKRKVLAKLPTAVHVKFPSLMGMFRPTRPEHQKTKEAARYGGLWYCNRTAVCGELLAGLRSNKAIMGQVGEVLQHLDGPFTAVHWRMFQCRDYGERAGKLVASLLGHGVPRGSAIYLLSGVTDPGALGVLGATFKVVTKVDANPRVMEEFPFSALALIDFEVAIRAERFYGIELLHSPSILHLSTFSAFAVQLRSMQGLHSALLPEDTFC